MLCADLEYLQVWDVQVALLSVCKHLKTMGKLFGLQTNTQGSTPTRAHGPLAMDTHVYGNYHEDSGPTCLHL